LDEDETFVAAYYDKVILELPSLVSTAIPVYLVDKSYVSVLVVDAGSPWARTEKQLLDMYMRVATHPVLTVLNRVEGDYIDTFGQLEAGYPQKRSANLLANRRNLPTG
ncbi:MAG: lipopolysaccharide biosynthesis protein, partial [Bacteroidetes bacterium]|nr:lipopolysaccharide biosynthesis protein [Fibrella sp.]